MIRILVVDSDATVATFVGRAFRSKGWLVDTAEDGATAVELSLTGRYQLVVLDLVAARVNGFSALKTIRATKPDQKVMVLTSAAGRQAGIRALEMGATDYLAKPFSVDELVARTTARLQVVGYTYSGHHLHCSGVTLDLARRTVDTDRGQISLTEREFVLLAHLMSEQEGRVFSRQELLSEVWGFSFDPGSNVVDVYIRRLRSKLGRDVIETIRNVGYALRAS